jgi:hypothetical protein
MDDRRVYFEGDPQTDSARRHLERVLSQSQEPRRRWPWVLGVLGGWTIWRAWRKNSTRRVEPSTPTKSN